MTGKQRLAKANTKIILDDGKRIYDQVPKQKGAKYIFEKKKPDPKILELSKEPMTLSQLVLTQHRLIEQSARNIGFKFDDNNKRSWMRNRKYFVNLHYHKYKTEGGTKKKNKRLFESKKEGKPASKYVILKTALIDLDDEKLSKKLDKPKNGFYILDNPGKAKNDCFFDCMQHIDNKITRSYLRSNFKENKFLDIGALDDGKMLYFNEIVPYINNHVAEDYCINLVFCTEGNYLGYNLTIDTAKRVFWILLRNHHYCNMFSSETHTSNKLEWLDWKKIKVDYTIEYDNYKSQLDKLPHLQKEDEILFDDLNNDDYDIYLKRVTEWNNIIKDGYEIKIPDGVPIHKRVVILKEKEWCEKAGKTSSDSTHKVDLSGMSKIEKNFVKAKCKFRGVDIEEDEEGQKCDKDTIEDLIEMWKNSDRNIHCQP